ncbi:C6 zink-finger PRO1A [Fusarium mexicanum]|uniref:C6 zink-finger PRO1A n=1 Tax=Fusarium mexicanum TaxID=751941 RepID=A0A8H5JCW9_9HYPO|nr:C6 zink-finger PRO1A [Fusarium mexicanum]
MMPPSPLPMDSLWMSSAATANQLQPGQISPLSAGLDNSSAPTMVHSASSSCADSWSTDYVDRDDVEMDNNWEQGSDDILTIPKLEPVEDDLNMDDLKAAPLPAASMDSAKIDPKPKRPRGRPRKHPLTTAVSASKVTKGRSKTGCITCRKRKKKCDEAKPRCMNCEKNAVVCEGYHEKQIWKSGKERAEEERLRQEALPIITIQPIFHGVETVEDKVFWKHYITHLSNVLTVEGEARNAFKDIILHLANEHQGLMHSILAVSSKHIDWDTPYGAKLLADHPQSNREALQQRADYHHDESMKRLYEDMGRPLDKDDPEYKTILSARYGQMLCLLLQTRADGNPRGEHRVHLQAYQTLIQHSPPEDPALYTFITEFFQYHIFADDLFWHPENMTARLSSEDWEPVAPIQPPRLIGVGDGLFQYLSQITTIRNTIRANIAAGVDPVVDYTSLYQAAEIDAAIREWTPNWPWGDSRDRVGLLYKQMMWVYLFRTIYPPSVSSMRRSTFSTLPISASTTVAPPPPPPRRASMMATVLRGNGVAGATDVHMASSCPTSRNPSRTNSMHEQDSSTCQERASSPPPSRRPAYHDRRITLAVEESLTILESFKPSDPSQTLLLIPCLVIGTACFEPAQQERIRTAVRAVRGYTGLRNCERVMELLERVWACMDQGDWVSVWDWQGVARRMRLDFSCA